MEAKSTRPGSSTPARYVLPSIADQPSEMTECLLRSCAASAFPGGNYRIAVHAFLGEHAVEGGGPEAVQRNYAAAIDSNPQDGSLPQPVAPYRWLARAGFTERLSGQTRCTLAGYWQDRPSGLASDHVMILCSRGLDDADG